VWKWGAARYLRSPPQAFDVVFLDPPFGEGRLGGICSLAGRGPVAQTGAQVYLENAKSDGVRNCPLNWELLKSKSAGEVGYHLARVNARAQTNA